MAKPLHKLTLAGEEYHKASECPAVTKTIIRRSRANALREKQTEDKIVRTLRKFIKEAGYPTVLLPHVRGGVRLFNYLINATRAAERFTKVPRGFKLQPVTVETSSLKGIQEAHVADLIQQIVKVAIKDRESQEPQTPSPASS